MNRLILFLLIFFAVPIIYAQSDLSPEQVAEYQQIKDEIAGTYQIEMIDTRSLPTIELSLFQQIQAARMPSETVFIQVNHNCRVKILSEDEINASGFQPLEYVTYINSKQ